MCDMWPVISSMGLCVWAEHQNRGLLLSSGTVQMSESCWALFASHRWDEQHFSMMQCHWSPVRELRNNILHRMVVPLLEYFIATYIEGLPIPNSNQPLNNRPLCYRYGTLVYRISVLIFFKLNESTKIHINTPYGVCELLNKDQFSAQTSAMHRQGNYVMKTKMVLRW